MNGREEYPFTFREITTLLKENELQRITKTKYRKEEHNALTFAFNTLCSSLVVIMITVTCLYLKSSYSNNTNISWVQSTESNDDEWFHAPFSHDMLDVERAISERWWIGSHAYTTRDLMGRNI